MHGRCPASAPGVGTALNDQSCGRTLTGVIDWYEIDAADWPTLWTELCSVSWDVTGELVTDYDDIECVSCRCEYASVVTLDHDDCGWYEADTTYDVTVAFAPTVGGPATYADDAAEWPWLGYMNFDVDWGFGLPEPAGTTTVVYLGQDSEDALSQSFDAAEIQMYAVSMGFAPNGSDYVDNHARFGISH